MTRLRLITCWTRSLAAAVVATDAAFVMKALDEAELTAAQRRLRQERDWLNRFERDSLTRFP